MQIGQNHEETASNEALLTPGMSNATIYRRTAADSALIDWVMVSAGWTRD
jgi:hypothetical protein